MHNAENVWGDPARILGRLRIADIVELTNVPARVAPNFQRACPRESACFLWLRLKQCCPQYLLIRLAVEGKLVDRAKCRDCYMLIS